MFDGSVPQLIDLLASDWTHSWPQIVVATLVLVVPVLKMLNSPTRKQLRLFSVITRLSNAIHRNISPTLLILASIVFLAVPLILVIQMAWPEIDLLSAEMYNLFTTISQIELVIFLVTLFVL